LGCTQRKKGEPALISKRAGGKRIRGPREKKKVGPSRPKEPGPCPHQIVQGPAFPEKGKKRPKEAKRASQPALLTKKKKTPPEPTRPKPTLPSCHRRREKKKERAPADKTGVQVCENQKKTTRPWGEKRKKKKKASLSPEEKKRKANLRLAGKKPHSSCRPGKES